MTEVIIPYYNNANTLYEALTSLTIQTKKDFKVIIVDDCSQEDPMPVIQTFNGRLDILYCKLPKNVGPGLARQAGLDYAYTQDDVDYIMFLDSDDLLLPRAVEVLTREIKANNFDYLTSPVFAEQNNGPGVVINPQQCLQWSHGKIYRKEFLKEQNIRFSEVIRYSEDSAFNLTVHYRSAKNGALNEYVCLWRANPKSLTRETGNDFSRNGRWQYVYGQCEALENITRDKAEAQKELIATVKNIYEGYEKIFIEGENTEANVRDKIKQTLSMTKFVELFNNSEALKAFLPTLTQGYYMQNGEFRFFKHSFTEWCKELDLDEIYNYCKKFIYDKKRG